MRHLRLVLPALAFVVAGACATQVLAFDKHKGAAAAASMSGTCTAEMAAKCTPEMAAACKAKGAKTTSADHCAGMKGSNVSAAAAAQCPGMMGVAMTASSNHCAGKATTATSSACGMKGATTTATVAGANGACTSHSTATVAGAGQCSGHANSTAKMAHGDCDACADMVFSDQELIVAGARTQVVRLKNGVMYLYTAENPGKVSSLQTAMARRTERLQQIISAGDKARLCADCKTMRGAMASGKLNREVVNIEGGSLTLVTSNDPAMIARIQAMSDAPKLARAKI